MKYTLYLAKAEDDRHVTYAYAIADYAKIIDEGVYVAIGERKDDENYCGHVALQRALRQAIRKCKGQARLTVVLDNELIDDIAFEILGVSGSAPLYPSLCRTTQRIMKRFASCDLAAMTKDESDLRPAEASVIDEALNALEDVNTLVGRIKLWRDIVINPQKIIR